MPMFRKNVTLAAAIGTEDETNTAVVVAAVHPGATPYDGNHPAAVECVEAQVVVEQLKRVAFVNTTKSSTNSTMSAFFDNGSERERELERELELESAPGTEDSKKTNNGGSRSFSPDWFTPAMIAMTLIFVALLGYGFGSGLFLSPKNSAIPNGTTGDPFADGVLASGAGANPNFSASSETIQDRQDYKYSIVTLLGLPMVMERTSPQARAVEWLAYLDEPLYDVAAENEPSLDEQDHHRAMLLQRYALVVWYFDQGGPTVWKTLNRDESAGWIVFGAGVHECDWKGVDCDYDNDNDTTNDNTNDNGTVVGLRLSPALGLILTGTSLSTELGMLVGLRRIDFSSQRLQGTIPDEWASMTNLESVLLSKNQLQTTIPGWIGRSPEDGGGWSNLEQLTLDGNLLYGSLPSSMSNLRRLTHLELQVNPRLEGRFDEILFSDEAAEDNNPGDYYDRTMGTNLEVLDLSNTGLKGRLPRITLPSIRSFRLWNMPGFWGTLPREIGTWSNLEIFSIAEMPGLTGTVPTEFGALEKLQILEVLDSTSMSGELPSELGNLSSNLKTINFRYANQTGTLPSEWSSLVNLETINLLLNKHLTGTVPTEYAQLTNLKFLDLRGTDLSGEVSEEICAIESIDEFRADCSYKNDKSDGKIVCVCCLWCNSS